MTRIVQALLLVFTMLVAGACYAQDADVTDDDESSIDESLTAAERASLNAVLAREPAADLTQKQLFKFYGEQNRAAFRLGDVRKELAISQKWLASAGDDLDLQLKPTWRLWNANIRGGDVGAGIAYAENILQRLPAKEHRLYRIRMMAGLSRNYSELLQLQRATELLDQAEKEYTADRRQLNPAGEYQRSRAQRLMLAARSQRLRRRGKFADAEVVARREMVLAEKGIQDQMKLSDSTKSEGGRGIARSEYTKAIERVMHLQIDQTHLNEAAVTGQILLNYFRDQKLGGSNLNATYLMIAELMLAKYDLPRAEFYTRTVIKNTTGQSNDSPTKPGIAARKNCTTS